MAAPVFDLSEYLFLAVIAGILAFVYAFGIGANDVANAFASTVSSKSLTLKQAIVAAAIFEFSGALFLGASVGNTIRSKIFSVKLYEDHPETIMLGMLTSMMAANILLLLATYCELPVSTTHTVVGCIMGFSICAKGFDSIDWKVGRQIFLSWIISPSVSGFVGFIFFSIVRVFIMRHDNSFERAFYLFPIVLLFGIGINVFYILTKGIKNLVDIEQKYGLVVGISLGVGAAAGILWVLGVGPMVKRRVEMTMDSRGIVDGKESKKLPDNDGEEVFSDDIDDAEGEQPSPNVEKVEQPTVVQEPEEIAPKSHFGRMSKAFGDATYNQDLQTMSLHESKTATEIWEAGIQYDARTEELFTYIQVFTACLNSFAHGANDVANAIAPAAAVINIYQDGFLNSKSEVPKWLLAYGGFGIVVGLTLYGYKIIKALGYKMTILSPSRGACAELSASLFVVTASYLAIPVSTTQCIVGAVAGVGLAGGAKNLNWLYLLRTCCGWVVEFFTATLVSAAIFSFCAFSPSLADPVVEITA